MTDTKLREAFEAEIRCEEKWGHRSLLRNKQGGYANWCVDLMWDVWQAALAAPAAEPEQSTRLRGGVPDVRSVDRGFRWDGEAQHHVPTLLIEFEPVPAGSPNNAKGWEDRDALASALTAAPQAPALDAWISVADEMPDSEPGSPPVLFYSDDLRNPTNMMLGIYRDGKWLSAGFEFVNVTHWKPKPETPDAAMSAQGGGK